MGQRVCHFKEAECCRIWVKDRFVTFVIIFYMKNPLQDRVVDVDLRPPLGRFFCVFLWILFIGFIPVVYRPYVINRSAIRVIRAEFVPDG